MLLLKVFCNNPILSIKIVYLKINLKYLGEYIGSHHFIGTPLSKHIPTRH